MANRKTTTPMVTTVSAASSGKSFILDEEKKHCYPGDKYLGSLAKNDSDSCFKSVQDNKEKCSQFFFSYDSASGWCTCQLLNSGNTQCTSRRATSTHNVYRIVTSKKSTTAANNKESH